MEKSQQNFLLGIFVLALSLIMWRATGSFIGWFVLFAPGSFFIFRGLYLAMKEK
jgi:hypothetical protein